MSLDLDIYTMNQNMNYLNSLSTAKSNQSLNLLMIRMNNGWQTNISTKNHYFKNFKNSSGG